MHLLGLESSGLNSNSKGKPFILANQIHHVDIGNSVKPNKTKKIQLDLIIRINRRNIIISIKPYNI